jgi:hypothetical protein
VSLLRNLRPGIELQVPGVRDRDQHMSVSWRKAGRGWVLSVGFAKTIAVAMGFILESKARNICEVGYDERTGELVIVNGAKAPDKSLCFRLANRRGSLVLSMSPRWLKGYEVTHAAERCAHRVVLDGPIPMLTVTLPDWAAPKRAGFTAAKNRATDAADAARAKMADPNARPTHPTPFHTAATRP